MVNAQAFSFLIPFGYMHETFDGVWVIQIQFEEKMLKSIEKNKPIARQSLREVSQFVD
jgi:hypothetical protein